MLGVEKTSSSEGTRVGFWSKKSGALHLGKANRNNKGAANTNEKLNGEKQQRVTSSGPDSERLNNMLAISVVGDGWIDRLCR